MQQQTSAPWSWLWHAAAALPWSAVVVFAFWAGRYMQRLETRLERAEASVHSLLERHMPHIHNALAEIRGLLQGRR